MRRIVMAKMPKAIRRAVHRLHAEYINRLTSDWMVEVEEHQAEPPQEPGVEEARARDGAARIVQIGPPWGETNPRDYDRAVPEFEGDFPAVAFAVARWRTSPDRRTRYRVFYNVPRIEAFRPGPGDWRKIRAHERAHARGFGHFEGSPQTNAAYYPRIRITGR